MNCPICLTNLCNEVKYKSQQEEYYFYYFCPDCGSVIGYNLESLELEEIDSDDLVNASDAAKAYITNRIVETVTQVELEDIPVIQAVPAEMFYAEDEQEVVPLLQLELEEMEKEINEIEAKIEDERIREVPEDIQHQLDVEGFGDYLIIINDYKEADFELFTGSKQELNEHLKALNLHNAPKVYTLKQLPVHTTYSI